MIKQYSQLGQDVQAHSLFKDESKCYFIEIGAHDGEKYSNTFLLEKLGWSGICIEANPELYKRLKHTRKKSKCVKAACYSESGKTLDFCKADLLGGLSDHIGSYKDVVKDKPTFKVQTKTLTEILNTQKAPKYIHFLSIDTEGSELEILKGIDFNRYSFGLISIEHNYEEPRRTDMKHFLESQNYRFWKENKWDDDYLSTKLFSSIK